MGTIILFPLLSVDSSLGELSSLSLLGASHWSGVPGESDCDQQVHMHGRSCAQRFSSTQLESDCDQQSMMYVHPLFLPWHERGICRHIRGPLACAFFEIMLRRSI